MSDLEGKLDKMADVRCDLRELATDPDLHLRKHEYYHLMFVAKELGLVMDLLRRKIARGRETGD